jgi:hypothetical protein
MNAIETFDMSGTFGTSGRCRTGNKSIQTSK